MQIVSAEEGSRLARGDQAKPQSGRNEGERRQGWGRDDAGSLDG